MTSFPLFVVYNSHKTTPKERPKGDRSIAEAQAARGGRSGSPLWRVQLGYIHRSSHHDRLHHGLNDNNGNTVASGEEEDNDDGGIRLRNRTKDEEADGIGVEQYKQGGNWDEKGQGVGEEQQ